MFRPLLTALVVAAYLATQMATVPHAHAVEIKGHGLRPHLHTAQQSQHKHSHGKHSHRHDQHSHDEPSPSGVNHDNHDDGCIYLPDSLLSSTEAKVQSHELTDAGFAAVYDVSTAAVDLQAVTFDVSFTPPDILRRGCDLCVMLRTLRI